MAKPKLKSFVVRVRSTVIEDYIVDAENEADAESRFMIGEGADPTEVERPDCDIEKVWANE